MKKKLVVYLATPYALVVKSKEIGISKQIYAEQDKALRVTRFVAVNDVAAKLIGCGFAVISPISQSHPIAVQCNLGGTFETWEDIDYNIILRCDMVIVFCQYGWQDSVGVQKEIAFALQNNIPVIYIDEDLKLMEGECKK